MAFWDRAELALLVSSLFSNSWNDSHRFLQGRLIHPCSSSRQTAMNYSTKEIEAILLQNPVSQVVVVSFSTAYEAAAGASFATRKGGPASSPPLPCSTLFCTEHAMAAEGQKPAET